MASATDGDTTGRDAAGLDGADRAFLLRLARVTIEDVARGRKASEPRVADVPPGAAQGAACFVTLYEHGQLRGCMGTVRASEPLWRAVAHCAISASTEDPRFPPVSPPEVTRLDLHISVLSPIRRLEFTDTADMLRQIEPNRHGVVLERGQFRGLYLPQVWEMFEGPGDRHAPFLTSLSQKAGDRTGTLWRARDVDVSVFEAVAFGEADHIDG